MRLTRNFPLEAGFAVLLALATSHACAQVVYLDHQHMDFRFLYHPDAEDTNRLDIQLRYNATSQEGPNYFYATNQEVYIVGNTNAKKTISSNPNFAFLGPAGGPVWILPQTQNTNLPFLGTSGEDLPGQVFDSLNGASPSGQVKFELKSVEGPGNFFLWQAPGPTPLIYMIATNGVVNTQYNHALVSIGNHAHYAWGFGTSGLYRVTFRCSGTVTNLDDGPTNILGREVAWAFQILPLRPWETWVSTNWLPATATNLAGPQADPDGDGILNVFEYAFGNDPNQALRTNLPSCVIVSTNGLNYGALRYVRATNATDLELSVLAADAPAGAPWTNLTNTFSIVTNGPTEIVTMRDEVPVGIATNRFYQLRVKLNYP